MMIFDAQDLIPTYEKFNAGKQTVLEDGPIRLKLDAQQLIINTFKGRAFPAAAVWTSDDHEAGRVCLARIETLGAVVVNTVESKTPAEYVGIMMPPVPPIAYGKCRTINVHK